jgi:DNA ligase-1
LIPQGFKPNLAATLTKPELIQFPVWASPKIDGIRCVVFGGVAYSRSLKPIPNPKVQTFFSRYRNELDGLDGELVVGRATDPNCMQNSMAVMSKSNPLDEGFTFYVFDAVLPNVEFWERSDYVYSKVAPWERPHMAAFIDRVKTVPQHMCTRMEMLDEKEAMWLAEGYEGMMIRDHCGLYKHGRSTEREGGLVKVKRFVDAEAVIVGFEEEMKNENEATKDATGKTERSTAKAGLVGKGTLGALVVERGGVRFNIGTGFTASQRRELWEGKSQLLGRLVTFKHFDHGTVDAPRHPVYKAFRHIEDT